MAGFSLLLAFPVTESVAAMMQRAAAVANGIPETGARSLLRAFEATDIPEDPEQLFLTSWGEWWPKSVYEHSLDRGLQDKWCPSREQIEEEAGL